MQTRELGRSGLKVSALGLGCMDFHRNKRAVQTPSSEQVRRPINREGVDSWRPYEPWLGPLRDALGDALEYWDR